jgi:histidine triad (HIT) family protein
MSFCLFCSIVRGEISAHKIYESDKVLAFLDKYPSAPGHTLIIPKTHISRVEDLTLEDAKAVFLALHNLVGGIQEAMGAPASTIGINNGREAGQEVPHVHIHIIPRNSRSEGGIIQGIVDKSKSPRQDLEDVAKKIREKLVYTS